MARPVKYSSWEEIGELGDTMANVTCVAFFDLGDFAKQVEKKGMPKLAARWRLPTELVRKVREMAVFYSAEVRSYFIGDTAVLGWEHGWLAMKAAKKFGQGLEAALAYLEAWAKDLTPADMAKTQLLGEGVEEQDLAWERRMSEIAARAEKVADDDEAPERERNWAREAAEEVKAFGY
jgi:hypothetical protein